MHFDIITIFPEMFAALDYGIVARAKKNGLIGVKCWNPRDYTSNKHRHIDDKSYGGGPGMVLMFEPLQKALAKAKSSSDEPCKTVYLSPQGRQMKQQDIANLVSQEKTKRFIFISGRYEGIDERFVETEVDEEWSIGDYVLSGGEFAVMVLIDAITRLIPNALGKNESIVNESFSNDLLDYPHYTRPETINDKKVPKILLSGDHKKIANWRLKQSLGRTFLRRPELLEKKNLTKLEKLLLNEFIKEMGLKNE